MRRDWLTLIFGVVLVGTVVGLSLRQNLGRRSADQPVAESEPAAAAAPAPALPTPTPAPEPREPAAPPARVTPRPPATPVRAAEPPRAAAVSGVTLQVQSDIPGASVFLDREFVGTTPLTLRGLTPGQKQLNVTATGHEGYAAPIELTDGANRVNVEFNKVRLDTSVPVVHRHAMGSCQGMLAATAKGLSYDTPNTDDAFTLSFADIDEFDVDYLKKNLRIRRRAGRTWNFTNDSADALFVFHRDVAKARERLSKTP
jgi:hypothetical protein